MSPQKDLISPPVFQRALKQDAKGSPHLVSNVAVPALLPGTVLVKTVAVALNPSDYKMGSAFPVEGAIVGFDFAGKVVCVGEGAHTKFQPGDRVCGAVHGSNPAEPCNGAFAEYVRVPADLLLRIPASLGWVGAATLGTGLATCLLTLWGADTLRISATPDAPAEAPLHVLVYGGSTATGTMAIQLLKLSGLDPIATASPHNFDLVRAYGASAVFDYTAQDTPAVIRTHTGGRLKYALDCIGDEMSVACCYGAIQRAGGFYTSLEVVPEESLRKRRAIKASFVMAAEIYGKEVKLGRGYERPANEAKYMLAIHFIGIFQKLLNEGRLKTHPTEVLKPGLEGVLDGLDLLKSGSVTGKKLVALISPII